MATQKARAKLSWRRDDIERRLGFEGGRFTKVGAVPTGLMALASTIAFYLALVGMLKMLPSEHWTRLFAYIRMFTDRGWTTYAVVLLGFWTFFILIFKTRKIKLQRAPLSLPLLPETPDFALTVRTVDDVANQIAANADSPKDFMVYKRVVQTLSNLRNLGRVTDVDALFRSQAEQDENLSDTSYSLVSGFLWAIPILGFIGTVIGLSAAIGNFTSVLTSASDIAELTPALKDVTAGLSTAFETTLVALAVALSLQLFATFIRKSEEELLNDVAEFCAVNVVSKLRVEPERRRDDEEDSYEKEEDDGPK